MSALLQKRLKYEAEAMREMHRHCPEHVPELYSFDAATSVLAMQYLAPPHLVLRYSILDGHVHPKLAAQAARQLACCLFRTSCFKLSTEDFWAAAARFDNPAMCDLTQQVGETYSFWQSVFLNWQHDSFLCSFVQLSLWYAFVDVCDAGMAMQSLSTSARATICCPSITYVADH